MDNESRRTRDAEIRRQEREFKFIVGIVSIVVGIICAIYFSAVGSLAFFDVISEETAKPHKIWSAVVGVISLLGIASSTEEEDDGDDGPCDEVI